MKWATAATTLAAAITWTAAVTVGVTSHAAESTVLIAVYLVIGAGVASIAALGLWLTDRVITELRANRAVGHKILAELKTEHDDADRALRSLLRSDDDSNPRIRRIHT